MANNLTIKILLTYHERNHIISSDIISPIQTGCTLSPVIFKHMLQDDDGENISIDNPRYCELTAQYWAWKNYEKIGNPEYIGFMHWRRHFMFDGYEGNPKNVWLTNGNVYLFDKIDQNYLEHIKDEYIYDAVRDCDCIVIKPYDVKNICSQNIKEQFIKLPGLYHKEIFEIFIKTLKKHAPNFLDEIELIENGSVQYLCNMFIMRKDLFFEYNELCFSILTEVDKQVDHSQMDEIQMRFLGYLGEFLLSIFIFNLKKRDRIRIKELNGSFIYQPPQVQPIPTYKHPSRAYLYYKLLHFFTFGKLKHQLKEKYKQAKEERIARLPNSIVIKQLNDYSQKLIDTTTNTNNRIFDLYKENLLVKNDLNTIKKQSTKIQKAIIDLNNINPSIKIISEILENKLTKVIDLENQTLQQDNDFFSLERTLNRFYQSDFEKTFLNPFFEYIDKDNFRSKYLELVHGLQEKDIFEINKILYRIKYIKQHSSLSKFNFYSQQEQLKKIEIIDDLRSKIVEIDKKLYCYGKWKLPINHFETCVFLYKHGLDTVKNKNILKDKVFIDGGAFIGDSALVLSEYTKNKIYSFEVNPKNLELLHETIELNALNNVIPVQKALYDCEDKLTLNICGSASSLNKLHGIDYDEKTITVQTISLDKFVEDNNIKNIGLIKVDLEGAEQRFLKGAEKTIKAQKPLLLISIYHTPSDFFDIKPLIESWNLGYEFTVFNPVDWGILIETMIICEIK